MAYEAHVGSFNIDSAVTAGNDQSVTGTGFEPKIVLFWWSGSTATSDSVAGGNINIGFGAAISSSSRFCTMGISEDAQAVGTAYSYQSASECIRCYSDISTLDGLADFKSMDANGFTLTIDDQFGSDWRISYLALGGSDLTDVYIGSKQRDADLGNCAVTGVGFQPDAVIIASIGTVAGGAESGLAGITLSLGMATGSSNQGAVNYYAQNNIATSNTAGYGYSSEVLNRLIATSCTVRDTFVSLDAGGFTLNQLEGTTQHWYYYICLKGGQYEVGNLLTRTDSNDIEENVGFEPTAVLFASANRAESTQDTPTDHGRLSIGAGTSATNRAAQAVSDEDGLADTETAYANQDDGVYIFVANDAVDAQMDLKSIDSDGFTCVMDDTEPLVGSWVMYLAIGADAAIGNPWYAYAQQ